MVRDFYEMQSHYCFSNTSAAEKWRDSLHFVLGKIAGKSRIAFIVVIRLVPGGSLCHKTNKMTCAHNEDLDQPEHSENCGKI